MMQQLAFLDIAVFIGYFLIVAGYGWYVYQKRRHSAASTTEYFLAEGSLSWWAIGASLIASNISAEQFIGMSGEGFRMGLAVASYEWMAAATLIIVAVFFMPVYLENRIFTMPQFLSTRYNSTVALIMAIFWLLLYVVVNLTSILFLGALAISSISGINIHVCSLLLALFALVITLGGMRVIGFTDVIQVFFLILGGLATTYLALLLVAQQNGESSSWQGFQLLLQHSRDHFHLILPQTHPKFLDMPGLTVLLGGMWVANFSYWGCNQYITQRALGADLQTARSGILFAAFLKLLMPLIVVLPGIAAYALYQHGNFHNELQDASGMVMGDKAYPMLLNLLPAGLKGLSFAALTAAIVASLAGKANSIATIFTLDIYKKIGDKQANERTLVQVGKWTVITALTIALVIAPYLGIEKGGLKYIQEYTGFVSPGIFAMFLLGLFWKRTSSGAALFATIGGFLFSVFLKFLPHFTDLSWMSPAGFSKADQNGVYEIPFLDRMGFVFLFCVAGMVLISAFKKQEESTSSGIKVNASMFGISNAFLVGSLLIVGILVALYSVFW